MLHHLTFPLACLAIHSMHLCCTKAHDLHIRLLVCLNLHPCSCLSAYRTFPGLCRLPLLLHGG